MHTFAVGPKSDCLIRTLPSLTKIKPLMNMKLQRSISAMISKAPLSQITVKDLIMLPLVGPYMRKDSSL